jgi:anti-sigma factor RsiW
MSETYHPTADRLEAFAEGRLERGEHVVIESHLLGCPDCQTQVDEWRALFAALEGLPQFDPRPGFADRVMAGVRLAPQAGWAGVESTRAWMGGQLAGAGAAVARVLPKTTFGWGLATALLSLPLVIGAALLVWVVDQSYLTPSVAWAYMSENAGEAIRAIGSNALMSAMQTDVVAWLVVQGGLLLETAGARGVGVLLAVGSVATMVSVWVLYRNLFRTPTRESNYVTYSF